MICLAFDTAGKSCSACLYNSVGRKVLASSTEEIGKGHAERLMDILQEVMQAANITYKELDKIVTTIGPGSFTGIRVGVATARGFGVGLNIPVIGVSNLEALLFELFETSKLKANQKAGAVIIAGREQVYCQLNFDSAFGKANTPFVADIDDLKNEFSKQQDLILCGNGARILQPEKRKVALDSAQATIEMVARLGASKKQNRERPEPLYLRKPDAVPQKGFAVERMS